MVHHYGNLGVGDTDYLSGDHLDVLADRKAGGLHGVAIGAEEVVLARRKHPSRRGWSVDLLDGDDVRVELRGQYR